MSESNQDNAVDDVHASNTSSVQVLIEPATPSRKERDGEDVSRENKIIKESDGTPAETSADASQENIAVVEEPSTSTEKNGVKVQIESSTLAQQERDGDDISIDNKIIEDSDQTPNETSSDAAQENVPVTEKPISIEADSQIISENENNNEDSKDDESGNKQNPSDGSNAGENVQDQGLGNTDEERDSSLGKNADVSDVADKPTTSGENDTLTAAEKGTSGETVEEVPKIGADVQIETEVDETELGENEGTQTAASNAEEAVGESNQEQLTNLANETDLSGGNPEREDTVRGVDNTKTGGEGGNGERVARGDVIIGEGVHGGKDEAMGESGNVTSADAHAEGEVMCQVTTDIATQDMDVPKKVQDLSEETERSAKTPESIAASVDLPINLSLRSPSRPGKGRPVTAESEFVYNENNDFPTPDYEMYGPTPTTTDSEKARRQLSPGKIGDNRPIASRGESTKSVTFADDIVGKGSERDGDDEEPSLDTPPLTAEGEVEEEEEKKQVEEEVDGETEREGKKEGGESEPEKTEEEGDAVGIFPTAVSEEKMEEARRKQQEGFTRKESLAIELFGASRFVPETMEDVITKKANEHFELGSIAMDQGEFGQAVLAFDKALNLLPREVRFYLMRGEAYLQLCDFQSAILNLKKACVLQPDNSEYYSRLAFVYYFQGQSLFDQCLFAEALESFSRAAEMKPDIIAYHTRSIACLAALQRHGECLALVNKRLETERSNPDLYIMRARLHQLFRNTTLCYYDLKDALALDPGQEEARTLMQRLERKAEESRNHAIRLQLQGKFKDSLTKITVAIEMNPSVSEYHLQRGALQRRLHDYNAAIDDFLLAMDKTEHDERSEVYADAQRQLLLTYNDFAVECFLGGHFEEAILLLNKALKGEKREKGLYINRGDCFFRLQELHFALADYHQASEIDAADPGIRSRVAAIHGQFGLQDYEEHSYRDAEARFSVAIQHNPRHGPYYTSRCKVRLMMENQTGARQDFLMALHLDSANTEILTLMPRIYPGKSVGDVLRTRHAKEAKMAADNAVMTASPIKLPGLDGAPDDEGGEAKGAEGAKHVTFVPTASEEQDAVVPALKSCMDESEFNKILTKQKKKISSKVKTMLHDRGTLFKGDMPKLKPQPPARPYEVRGGHWKNPEPHIKPGWRTFSLGVGLMD